MSKYRLLLFIITVLPLIVLGGCATPATPAPADNGAVTYRTDTSTDAMNYTTYVNKELDLVMNILSSHIANGRQVAKGEYIAEDEIDAAAESLVYIADAIDSVDLLNPPAEYEDSRLAILRRMNNAADTVGAYRAALEEGRTEDIDEYVKLMEGDYIALSGVFNVMWE